MTGEIRVRAIEGIGEARPGDDLAALVAARAELADGDVVCVAQKVVSKAEGRLAPLEPGEDLAAARRRLARAEAARVVVDDPTVLVVRTHHGWVCANGGVDASNVPDGALVLLPEDADASARSLRASLQRRTGRRVAVIVTDTFGRPWRRGQVDVAIGAAGLAALRDERGGVDRSGRPLEVTEVAVADELAAAADLARRKADGAPVVVVRGATVPADDGRGAAALVRPDDEDLFPRGRGMLAAALAEPRAPGPGAAPLDDADLAAAERAAEAAGGALRPLPSAAATRLAVDGDRLAGAAAAAALLDLGCAACWRDDPDDGLVVLAGRPPPDRPDGHTAAVPR